MKKLTPLRTMQAFSQMTGDKASLRWAKAQEARKAANSIPGQRKPQIIKKSESASVSAFGVEHELNFV